METSYTFHPPRRNGLILHSAVAIVLLGIGGFLLWRSSLPGSSFHYILMLSISVISLAPLPLVLYRGYALMRASYILERDGLRIRWGLRSEDIPLTEIEWVRPANELGFSLLLPFFRWPGSIIGVRDIENLGPVEFLAADTEALLLIATPERIFAISPSNPNDFQRSFRRVIEMGTPSPLPSDSKLPVAFFQQVWSDHTVRILILAGFIVTVALLLFVILLIPQKTNVSIGFNSDSQPRPPVPSERLLLLPVLGIFNFAVDLIVGLYFYRRLAQRPVAYLLWASSVLTPLMLVIAILFAI